MPSSRSAEAMGAAGPPQGAHSAPVGGSAAAKAASVGDPMTTAAASARVLRALPRLGELTAGRDNNLQLLRLAAAAAVLLFHCYALTDHWTDEPLWHLMHSSTRRAPGWRCSS